MPLQALVNFQGFAAFQVLRTVLGTQVYSVNIAFKPRYCFLIVGKLKWPPAEKLRGEKGPWTLRVISRGEFYSSSGTG